MPFKPRTEKRILVIDGGGFRGLGCLQVIDRIVKEASIATNTRTLLPCQLFDLICGTSSGGLLAILLGRLRMSCWEASEVYTRLGKDLFGSDEVVFWKKLSKGEVFGSTLFETSLRDGLSLDLMELNSDETPNPDSTTRTFVAIGSDAPSFTNRVSLVRSYPTPVGCSPSSPIRHDTNGGSPVKHGWRVWEAARATLADRAYLSPHIFSEETKFLGYGFTEAGAIGFGNLVDLAVKEAEKIWPGDKIGVVINLGAGTSKLVPPKPQQSWEVTDQYAQPFVEHIFKKLEPHVEGQQKENIMIVAKHVMSLAGNAELARQRASPSSPLYRIDPPLGLEDLDLADCFQPSAVERSVKTWLDTPQQKNTITEIISRLIEITDPIIEEPVKPKLTVDAARKTKPPAPPPDTNPNYNPKLDEKRPERMSDYLQAYRIVFVIDDSGSMKGARWLETRDALVGIAKYAVESKTPEIELCFLNSKVRCLALKDESSIIDLFEAVQPRGYTPTGAVLKTILDEQIEKLDAAIGKKEYYYFRPLDIIVITDGQPTDNPKDELVVAAAHLRRSRHHPNSIGIQFVQIGDDLGAEEALKSLITGDHGSMVDTVPYTEELTTQVLERIVLGGLHPNLRALTQDS